MILKKPIESSCDKLTLEARSLHKFVSDHRILELTDDWEKNIFARLKKINEAQEEIELMLIENRLERTKDGLLPRRM